MKIKVTQKFIDHRTDKAAIYNQRGRSDRQFLMDLDAEIYEWDKLNHWNGESTTHGWLMPTMSGIGRSMSNS